MGRRSRKRSGPSDERPLEPRPSDERPRKARPQVAPGPSRPSTTPPTRAQRNAARDEAARQSLTPLATGERPGPVTIAAIIAAIIGVANIALYAAGYEVRGEEPSAGGVVAVAAIMFIGAAGMWRARYWAVLGFQALLAITAIFAALSLLVASNVTGALLSIAITAGAGTLFWKLVSSMARIQMPERRAPR